MEILDGVLERRSQLVRFAATFVDSLAEDLVHDVFVDLLSSPDFQLYRPSVPLQMSIIMKRIRWLASHWGAKLSNRKQAYIEDFEISSDDGEDEGFEFPDADQAGYASSRPSRPVEHVVELRISWRCLDDVQRHISFARAFGMKDYQAACMLPWGYISLDGDIDLLKVSELAFRWLRWRGLLRGRSLARVKGIVSNSRGYSRVHPSILRAYLPSSVPGQIK